jgi:L-lactate dehydrogenase complex protein LldG
MATNQRKSIVMSARDRILSKLRSARRPFPDAAPRPPVYAPVVPFEASDPDALLERFRQELTALEGEVSVVKGQAAARERVLALLEEHHARRIASWHFKHIPVKKLYTAIQQAGYTVDYPHIHDAEGREAEIERLASAEVGLTGADAVIAATGSLVVFTGKGKSRLPTALPPVHIAVVRLKQLVPRLEDWLAAQRAESLAVIQQSANVCFITGPSRTADIEKQLVVGVHGPGRLHVVVVR